ncbi:MAG TPA: hypothetical protein VFK37_03195 [Bacillales bacterium]|nr:hypothetical protein [Bacillales bacterium]
MEKKKWITERKPELPTNTPLNPEMMMTIDEERFMLRKESVGPFSEFASEVPEEQNRKSSR